MWNRVNPWKRIHILTHLINWLSRCQKYIARQIWMWICIEIYLNQYRFPQPLHLIFPLLIQYIYWAFTMNINAIDWTLYLWSWISGSTSFLLSLFAASELYTVRWWIQKIARVSILMQKRKTSMRKHVIQQGTTQM